MRIALEVPQPCSHDWGAGALARAAVAIARAGEGAGAPAETFMVQGATKVRKGGATRWRRIAPKCPGIFAAEPAATSPAAPPHR